MVRKLWFHLVEMWKSLQTAIQEDKDWPVTNEETGKRESRVTIWFRTFWVSLLIILLAIFFIWAYIKPRSRTSHHGYNKNGERY